MDRFAPTTVYRSQQVGVLTRSPEVVVADEPAKLVEVGAQSPTSGVGSLALKATCPGLCPVIETTCASGADGQADMAFRQQREDVRHVGDERVDHAQTVSGSLICSHKAAQYAR